MLDTTPSPFHDLPSGLFGDNSRDAAAMIQRVARGDGTALMSLHEMWAPVLLGIACRMLGDRRAADELVRKVFIRIHKSAGTYDPHQSPPFVWAFTMLRDDAIECLRRGKPPRRQHPPAAERGEAAAVLSAEDGRRLKNALDLLDAESRVALEQAVFLDFSADATPACSLKTRLRLALEAVRTQLSCHEL